MVAMIASRRGASVAKLLEKMLVNPAPALEASSLSAVRSFKSNAQMRDASDDERSLDVDRRSDERLAARRRRGDIDSPFFSGVFDPFNPTRSLSQVLNLMDQMRDPPYPASARGMARRGWDVREDSDALHLRVDMPGLGKEHVKVSAEQNTLIIKGEGEKEDPEEEHSDHQGRGREGGSGGGGRAEVQQQDRPPRGVVQDGRNPGGDEERGAEGDGAQGQGGEEERRVPDPD